MSIPGIIAIVLGGISNALLFNAVQILSSESDGFYDIAAVIMMFIHLVLLLISYPFIVRELQMPTPIMVLIIGAEAVINVILMISIIFLLPSTTVGYIILVVILLLSAVPLVLIRFNFQFV